MNSFLWESNDVWVVFPLFRERLLVVDKQNWEKSIDGIMPFTCYKSWSFKFSVS